ncbi:capping protein, Arp2/3 and myosin-I linker protein 3 isoform X2 [Polyodon spathula]|uniref:capping protein, Arp2/3 and myosin-I linker protein 3 isoform X2 n=1 Tax=Polyodon spathula TaxID=7913 RepID=UPI001B7F6145|nr:capping protein, Arp2/3 and myosin-I linker protein 3 isoform X2 [Polyodon spathula]
MACSKPYAEVTREVLDSVKKVLDKSSIKVIQRIKLQLKSNRFEDKILVLTSWRLYLLAARVPTKVEITFNVLEIRSINSLAENQVVIETEKSTYCLRFQPLDDVDHVISHVNFALSKIFHSSTFAPSVRLGDAELSDGGRKFSPNSDTSLEATQGACGGFSETYAALCDYNGIGCKEEVQWDVDTIYHSQDNREFNLLDFSHLDSRDLAVIVASMAYNQWFTKLYCKDIKMGSEVTEQVLHTLSKSSSLEDITLENSGLKSDFALKLALALSENPVCVVHSLNLAHNQLDDKGVSSLVQQLCRSPKGLRLLNFSKTAITSRGLVSLSQALCSSNEFSSSLLHLDLSKNAGILSGEEAANLYLFLAQPNCLVHLDLSGTDCAIDTLCCALLRGCCADLSYLNLSRNAFSHKKSKETLPSFKQFFTSAFSLNHISLSGVKLPAEALRALFQGLSSNAHLNDVHLDISACELRSQGASVIQEFFSGTSCISTLDISDNGFDSDLLTVIPALGQNKSLRHILLGKNFNVKNRMLEDVLQKIVHLIQEEDCSLQSLSLTDSRLKSRTSILVNALGSNTCLRRVDLSGNSMEDIGAKMLAKALQINSSLRTVTWDRNGTTAQGFLDVARALDHNFTLQFMPVPLSDVTQAYRSAPERTEEALHKIQRSLLRNNQSQRFSQQQAFRLHQGIVTSTTEQVLERLCVKVQDSVRVLRSCPVESVREDLQRARDTLKEARNSRALFPSLFELGHILAVDGPVRHRLESVASDVSKAVDKELQVILESMSSLSQELCPLAVFQAESHNKTLSSVSERVTVPRSVVKAALVERAGQDIQNRLDEVKLDVVTYLTNSIVDEILQELYSSHKKLTRHISQLRRLAEQEAGFLGTLQDRSSRRKHRNSEDMTDEELYTSIDTIAIRKQTSRTRRIRPVSTFLSLSEPRSSSPPPLHSSLSFAPLSLSQSSSCEGLDVLPTQGAPLQHVTRVRPRPPRRHPRQPLSSAPPPPNSNSDGGEGGVSQLDEGLPDFYSKRVLPNSQSSSHSKSQTLPFNQKKRKNKRSIFTFRRNRTPTVPTNQSSEKPSGGGDCGEECRTAVTSSPVTASSSSSVSLRAVPSSFSSLYCTENYSPSTASPAHTDPEADGIEEVPKRKAQGGLVEAKPVQGILLPGMGLLGMGYPGKQKNDLDKTSEGKQTVRQEPVQTCFKPQPPPQSLKPSLATFRQTKVSETSAAFYLENEAAQDEENDVELAEEERERERVSEEEQRQTTNFPETAPPLPPSTLTSSQEVANEKQAPPPLPSPSSKPVFQKRERENSAQDFPKGCAPVKPFRTRRTYSTENETAVTAPPCNQGTQKDTLAPQTRPPDRKPAVKAKPLMNCPLVIETGNDNQTERELQS